MYFTILWNKTVNFNEVLLTTYILLATSSNYMLTVSLGISGTRVGGARPPHVSHDCRVTSEDWSCDLPLDPPPISEPINNSSGQTFACCFDTNVHTYHWQWSLPPTEGTEADRQPAPGRHSQSHRRQSV